MWGGGATPVPCRCCHPLPAQDHPIHDTHPRTARPPLEPSCGLGTQGPSTAPFPRPLLRGPLTQRPSSPVGHTGRQDAGASQGARAGQHPGIRNKMRAAEAQLTEPAGGQLSERRGLAPGWPARPCPASLLRRTHTATGAVFHNSSASRREEF